MRHSQSTGSSRTSTRRDIPTIRSDEATKRDIPTIRRRRPHRLVHHRQYPRTRGRPAVYRPERQEIYAKKLRRSPSRPRFYREKPEKVDERRGRRNFLEREKKETSHQANPEEKLSTQELNKILDQLVADIEERIRIIKKDQLSNILSRNIEPERDTRGTSPAQPETNE